MSAQLQAMQERTRERNIDLSQPAFDNRPTQHPAAYSSYRQRLQHPTGANPVTQSMRVKYKA